MTIADMLQSLFMQSAIAPTPPAAGPAPFASEMDPNERAAARLRAPYRTAVPLPQGPPPSATPGEMMQTAAMLALPSAVGMGAKVAVPALSAYLYGSGIDPASGNDAEQVKQLQIKLRDGGYYTGPIDGRMGPATARGQDAFLRAEQVRLQGETAAAQRASAEAQIAAAEMQRKQLEYREQGSERLREMEGDVPVHRRALRDYATPLGVMLGMIGGAGVRAGVTHAFNKASKNVADAAEGLFAGGARGTPNRVSRVNEFWRRGGAKPDEIPFLPTPGVNPGISANPNAAPIGQLYQPSRVTNAAVDAGVTGAFGADAAYGQFVLVPAANERLQRATEAASADPSEVNIRELQAAKDNLALADLITNLGRGGGAAYLGSTFKMPRSPSVPAMQKPEAEKLMLERLLRTYAKKD